MKKPNRIAGNGDTARNLAQSKPGRKNPLPTVRIRRSRTRAKAVETDAENPTARNAFLCLAGIANKSPDVDERLAGLDSLAAIAAALELHPEAEVVKDLANAVRDLDFWQINARDAVSEFEKLLEL